MDTIATLKAHPSAAEAPLIRRATMSDVPKIHRLLSDYAARGKLLPRTKAEIRRNIRDFFVGDVDGVVACGAIEVFTGELGEVRSLVVDPDYGGRGFGRALVNRIIDDAISIGLTRLMALTYEPEFFSRLGFEVVNKNSLPEKVWGVCVSCYKFNDCDEIAMVRIVG